MQPRSTILTLIVLIILVAATVGFIVMSRRSAETNTPDIDSTIEEIDVYLKTSDYEDLNSLEVQNLGYDD